MKTESIFGGNCLEKYGEGDLVSWTPIGHPKEYGLIKELYIEKIEDDENRKIAFALISTVQGKPVKLPLIQLNMESKRVKCPEQKV